MADVLLVHRVERGLELLRVLAEKLRSPVAEQQLDVCVSHDMTLYLMRAALLGVSLTEPDVAYLDGVVLFEEGNALKLRGLCGSEVTLSGEGD